MPTDPECIKTVQFGRHIKNLVVLNVDFEFKFPHQNVYLRENLQTSESLALPLQRYINLFFASLLHFLLQKLKSLPGLFLYVVFVMIKVALIFEKLGRQTYQHF